MSRLRWRLAQWISPEPILRDPGDGKVFILMRDGVGDDWYAWVKANKFRLKMTSRIPTLTDEWQITYEPTTVGRFVGTVVA